MKSGLEALMTKPPCDDDEAHFCLCETDFQGFIRSAIEWGRPGLLLHEGNGKSIGSTHICYFHINF